MARQQSETIAMTRDVDYFSNSLPSIVRGVNKKQEGTGTAIGDDSGTTEALNLVLEGIHQMQSLHGESGDIILAPILAQAFYLAGQLDHGTMSHNTYS
jgi:hypothetical protein